MSKITDILENVVEYFEIKHKNVIRFMLFGCLFAFIFRRQVSGVFSIFVHYDNIWLSRYQDFLRLWYVFIAFTGMMAIAEMINSFAGNEINKYNASKIDTENYYDTTKLSKLIRMSIYINAVILLFVNIASFVLPQNISLNFLLSENSVVDWLYVGLGWVGLFGVSINIFLCLGVDSVMAWLGVHLGEKGSGLLVVGAIFLFLFSLIVAVISALTLFIS